LQAERGSVFGNELTGVAGSAVEEEFHTVK